MLRLLLLFAFPDDLIDEAGVPVDPQGPAAQADEPADQQAPFSDTEGPLRVEHSQVTVKRQVPPVFPPEHRPGSADCVVELTINTKGRVEKAETVEAESCPAAFARNSETAGMKWRFEPFLVDGEPVVVVYPLKLSFRTS